MHAGAGGIDENSLRAFAHVVVTIFATKTTTDSTCPDCVDNFIDALKSPKLTAILAESGLRRP